MTSFDFDTYSSSWLSPYLNFSRSTLNGIRPHNIDHRACALNCRTTGVYHLCWDRCFLVPTEPLLCFLLVIPPPLVQKDSRPQQQNASKKQIWISHEEKITQWSIVPICRGFNGGQSFHLLALVHCSLQKRHLWPGLPLTQNSKCKFLYFTFSIFSKL